MTVSASLISPVSGSKKTRVRAGSFPPPKIAKFSEVPATVIKLIPSPPLVELIDCTFEGTSTKTTFETLDHLFMARLTAPRTSLPGLMFAPGEDKELERATRMVWVGHFI